MRKLVMIMTMIGLQICLLNFTIFAQTSEQSFEDVKKVAQTGYQFLKIGVGAHATGMADAAVTNESDAASVFWNPAGITSVEGKSLFVGYTSWFADIQHQAIAAVANMGAYGVFAVSAINMDYGDVKGTKISNIDIGYEDTGNLNVGEYAIGLSYGRRFTDKFGLGITVKFCNQNLDVRSSSVLAFDLGTIYNTGWKNVKIGMSFQHFSKEIKYIAENFVLPLTFRVGISADLLDFAGISSDMHNLNFAVEGVNPRDYSERVHVGAEYWFNQLIALRGGYKFNYDEESFSFGAGIRFMGIEVGYAYSDFGAVLGTVNRVSAQVSF